MAERCPTWAEKENVLIHSGECSVTLLPHLGGKISSIRIKNRELLQGPLAPLAPRTRTMSSDASGWDECLPSVADCTVKTVAGQSTIPDHGDLWRVEWESVGGENGSSVELQAKCFSLPLKLRRSFDINEDKSGWHLQLKYCLTNTAKHPVPWSWSAHPLFLAEPGDRILLPDSIDSLRVEGSGGERLGCAGDKVAWPLATLADGSRTNLSVAQAPHSRIGDKLFAGPLTAAENWCALERPSAGIRVRFRFDTAMTPYLGLWICYGGWPDGAGPKQNCVALEPSTAPVDSLARSGPWSRVLGPGQSCSWPMFVDLEPIECEDYA
jgi:galactose mutarotase-like enzyme